MNTSTNEEETEMKRAGGAFADGLTLIRVLLTPIVMFLIIAKDWPSADTALLAFILFAIAALTDVFDDLTGGTEKSKYRKFGWFDDIADIVLITGTLIAIFYVIMTKGALTWMFAVPAGIIVLREVIVGLVKGFELSKNGWPETRLGGLKTAIIMLAVCILLGSPWLTTWFESMVANDNNVMEIYSNTTNQVWNIGLVMLWIGALISIVTGFQLLTQKSVASDDS